MMKNKQADIIKNISDEVLLLNVWLTQLIVLIISIILALFSFDHLSQLLNLFEINDINIIYVGVTAGISVVLLDLILMKFLPSSWFDDGGINNRIFRAIPIWKIFFLTLTIAICEEFLFRGIIQYHTNLWIASVIFALVHYRYLFNPFLFLNVTLLSFFIGVLFKVTDNLFVTIMAHFIIDFLLGIHIRIMHKRTLIMDSERKCSE